MPAGNCLSRQTSFTARSPSATSQFLSSNHFPTDKKEELVALDIDEDTQAPAARRSRFHVMIQKPMTDTHTTLVVEQSVTDDGQPIGDLVVPFSKENLPQDAYEWVKEMVQGAYPRQGSIDVEQQRIRITVDCDSHTTDGCQTLQVGQPFTIQIIVPRKGARGEAINQVCTKWLGMLRQVDQLQPSL